MLEALSYGAPVIVGNHVGGKDIVGDNDDVVEVGNVKELKDAIKMIGRQTGTFVKNWQEFLLENEQMYGGNIND